MKIKILKPKTNGLRHQVIIQKNLLSKRNNIIKTLGKGLSKKSGRSSCTGRITVRHIGGRNKRVYREISLSYIKSNSIVINVMYDPFRNAFVSLNFDLNKKFFFKSLATESVLTGSLIQENQHKLFDLRLGFRTSLLNIPTGSLFHSLKKNGNINTKYSRAAGTFCQLIQKDNINSKVKLPSGLVTSVSIDSLGTLGVISNKSYNLIMKGKSGKNRHRGVRPCVRGIAMNPVDHPHGGRTNGGMHWVTPWGIPTKGKITVKKKKNV